MKRYLLLLAAPMLLLAGQPQENDPAMDAMAQMQREMNAAMQRFQAQMMRTGGFGSVTPMPRADLKSEGDHYELSMEIPGASEKSIKIDTRDQVITVSAEREEVQDVNESDYVRHERRISSYARSFSLPEDADTEQMTTDYKDGVLVITIPKKGS